MLGLAFGRLSEVKLVHFQQKRLDEYIRMQWELTLDDQDFPSDEEFVNYVEKHRLAVYNQLGI